VIRLVIVAAALLVCVAVGYAIGVSRSDEEISVLRARAEQAERDTDVLRNERDRLAGEVTESRRLAAELRDTSQKVKDELETKLARLEQLVAALVGTRGSERTGAAPTPAPSPEGGG
jgi:hypothetical protein